MSFILDALKKSEAERQRQTGPTLLELRVSPQRRRYPVWALWVGILLVVNAGILLFVLLRRPTAPIEPAAGVTRPAMLPTAMAPLPATASPPPAQSAAVPAPAQAQAQAPQAASVTAVAPLAGASSPNAPAAAPATNAAASTNPADDEPALPAGAGANTPRPALSTTTAATNYELLPNLSSLGGNLPSLQLNLLDYSELATERYALVNMHRVREGDVLPEGPRVLAITRDGVAMDYNGQQFILRSNSGASP